MKVTSNDLEVKISSSTIGKIREIFEWEKKFLECEIKVHN